MPCFHCCTKAVSPFVSCRTGLAVHAISLKPEVFAVRDVKLARAFLGCALILGYGVAANAAVRLPAVIGDDMVLHAISRLA